MEVVETLAQRKQVRVAEIRAGLLRLREELADYGGTHGGRFWIYGSAATGLLRFDSDIDVLAEFDAERVNDAVDFAEAACLRLRLKPDVRPKSWCSEAFLARITPHARVLP